MPLLKTALHHREPSYIALVIYLPYHGNSLAVVIDTTKLSSASLLQIFMVMSEKDIA